jgi:hypothetical protein
MLLGMTGHAGFSAARVARPRQREKAADNVRRAEDAMTDVGSSARQSIKQLILVPAIVTLVVTLLRLLGELQHWSTAWFTTDMGPSIVAIVWLAPLFGVYFALRLAARGEGPASPWRAIVFAMLGVAVVVASFFVPPALHLNSSFYTRLIAIWSILALGTLATLPGWPTLFKTMLAYAYSARIPVAILMFFAIRGSWGTHYDAAPSDMPAGMALLPKYLWLGFFPQLIFWVGFTTVSGMLCGSIAAASARLVRRAQPGAERRSAA